MQKSFKRFLSLALSLMLVLSLVPATAFASEADTTDQTQSETVAINTATGKTYTSVATAAAEAEAEQTVQLTQNAKEISVILYKGALDLNGYTLEADYMTSYGDLIDSSEDNTGLLIAPAKRFMVQDDNLQLPVKDGDGYRFVEVIGFNSAMVADNKYAFQPLFEEDAHQYLAAGSAATGITIQVEVSWISDEGADTRQFVYNDTLLGGYIGSYKPATGKYGKMFTLTQYSTGSYEELAFEAQVFSDADVYFNAGKSQPEKKDEEDTVVTDDNNQLVNPVTVYHKQGSAVIAAGTQLEDGVTKLELTATTMTDTGSNVTVGNGEELLSMDVHVSGISKDNTVPVIITLNELAPELLNKGNLALYHVEDGVTVPMTRVYSLEEVDAHNEYYYDIPTGTVTVALATFSEVARIANLANPWTGAADHSWYDPAKTELTIANADQLWSFSQIVGGMAYVLDAEGNETETAIAQDSFKGKTVKLLADINLGDSEKGKDYSEDGRVFYPVGYYNNDIEANGVAVAKRYEKTSTAISSGFYSFAGTFDGNGRTIKNFYQNTWEMKGDHNWYAATDQHYRDGMGLFGKVNGGTIKNLTIENFSSDGEITTTGTVAAYADCGATFENIQIFNCNPRVYNIGNGGIVGCVGWYANTDVDDKVTFKNITVDNTNKISALWGSYDVACGGIVGQYYPTSGQSNAIVNKGVHFENCHVAAVMDVYNDVCANYQYYAYRYTGMMIGSVRENETIDGHVYPKMDGISASGCTVHFGDWNDYYYCELVANTTASYTHDHQMSRLTQVASVDVNNMKVTDLNGKETAIPASGRVNYVVVKEKDAVTGLWIHGDGHDYAECYHFVNGVQHKHDVADSDNTEVYETVNNETVLKEDKQLVYREFKQLITGYGWGVTSKGVGEMDGVTILDDITDAPNAVEKFVATDSAASVDYTAGQTVSIGTLFKKNPENTRFDIDVDNVQVTVTPADEYSTAGATYKADTTNWENGTLTFTGYGEAEIIISDYYYCIPTTLKVMVVPTVDLVVSTHENTAFAADYSDVTRFYLSADASSDLPLANAAFTNLPAGWTLEKNTSGATAHTDAAVIATFTAKAGTALPTADELAAVTGSWTVNVDYGVDSISGADRTIPVIINSVTISEDPHYGWTGLANVTKLPTTSGQYYLTQDVKLTAHAVLPEFTPQDITLCLCGHSVDANSGVITNYGSAYYVPGKDHKLTVCNCGNKETAIIKNAEYIAIATPNRTTPYEGTTEEPVDENMGTVITVRDVTFTENNNTHGTGGAVLVQEEAVLLADNVKFYNNSATADAGAVYVDSGLNHRITNCRFEGNSATNKGSALYLLNGIVTMSGCTVKNNTVNATTADGDGALHIMPDGVLWLDGNNLFSENYEIVKDAEGNETSKLLTHISMDNVRRTDKNGVAVDLQDYPRLRFRNRPADAGIIQISCALGFDALTEVLGDERAVVLTDYLKAENCASTFMVECRTGGSEVVKYYKYDVDKEIFVDASHGSVEYHTAANETGIWQAWTSDSTLPTESGNYYLTRNVTLPANGVPKIDSQTSGKTPQSVVLCLNGFTVDAATSWSAYRLDGPDNSLTICDCSAHNIDPKTDAGYAKYQAKVGKITGSKSGAVVTYVGSTVKYNNTGTTINIRDGIFTGNDYKEYEGKNTSGGVFWIQSGASLNITGGIFENNKSSSTGGVIYLGQTYTVDGISVSSTATVTNAVFKGNTADTNGGAIYKNHASVLTVEDCVFDSNTAATNGAAIYVGTGSTTITNCTFTDNAYTAESGAVTSGAVHVNGTESSLTLDGSNAFSGNYWDAAKTVESNIYVASADKITFQNVTSGTPVVIRSANALDVAKLKAENCTAAFTIQNVVGEATTNFVYNVVENAFYENVHSAKVAEYHTGAEASDSWQALGNVTQLPKTSGHYYLTQDITVSSMAAINSSTGSAAQIVLCLNGFSIKGGTNRAYSLTGPNNSLTICDCTRSGSGENLTSGKITGFASTSDGGVIFTPNSGNAATSDNETALTINIRHVTFDGNSSTGYTGAIHAQGGACLTVTGAKFTNNAATKHAGAIYMCGGTHSITDTYFGSNTADINGGAIWNSYSANTVITSSKFDNNKAVLGGAIYMEAGQLKLTSITYSGNTASSDATTNDIYHKGGTLANDGAGSGPESAQPQ